MRTRPAVPITDQLVSKKKKKDQKETKAPFFSIRQIPRKGGFFNLFTAPPPCPMNHTSERERGRVREGEVGSVALCRWTADHHPAHKEAAPRASREERSRDGGNEGLSHQWSTAAKRHRRVGVAPATRHHRKRARIRSSRADSNQVAKMGRIGVRFRLG